MHGRINIGMLHYAQKERSDAYEKLGHLQKSQLSRMWTLYAGSKRDDTVASLLRSYIKATTILIYLYLDLNVECIR